MPQQDPSPAPPDPSHPAPILEYAGPHPPASLNPRRLLHIEHPAISVVGVLIALAVGGYLLWALLSPTGEVVPDCFYTIDDGKSVFVDNHHPGEPFQKDGKDAVLAVVFTCDNNKTNFVGYLLKREEVPAKFSNAPPGAKMMTNFIKKPGDTEWIPETNMRKWNEIERSVKCPEGQGQPIMVTPQGMLVEPTTRDTGGRR